MYPIKLPCRYHIQDYSNSCGAACAMMTLASLRTPLSSLDQNVLMNDITSHHHTIGWETDPLGLAGTLKDISHANYVSPLREIRSEALNDIVQSLLAGLPVSVLIYGGNPSHWVVVWGVDTDNDPNMGDYTPLSFYINDPVFQSEKPDPPPPHAPPPHAADDLCGSGQVYNQKMNRFIDYGSGNTAVSYRSWLDDYFVGCNFNAPMNKKQYISVNQMSDYHLQHPPTGLPMVSQAQTLLAPKQLYADLPNQLKSLGYDKNEATAGAIANTRPSEPLIVRRIDRADQFYYLIPLEKGKNVSAVVRTDAFTGEVAGLQTFRQPIPSAFITQEQANKLLLAQDSLRSLLRQKTYSFLPTLVWRPCRESLSPFLPFYRIDTGFKILYVRIDGIVYEQLTITGNGL